MKIYKLTIAVILLLVTVTAQAQTVSLDRGISDAVDRISRTLDRGSVIAIMPMRTDSPRMSSYLIDEATSAFVNKRMFTVVDRSRLDAISRELTFQMSGAVSFESAQAVGEKLGAQIVIVGSFEPIGNHSRLVLQAIHVRTAAVVGTASANIRNDAVVSSLMGESSTMSGYEDFTTGQRWATGVLNLIPGLGSFTVMNDFAGGSIHLGLMAVGGVFMYMGVTDVQFASGGAKYSMKAPGLAVGSAFLLGGTVFNITRSILYSKPHTNTASLDETEFWDFAVMPGRNGVENVYLSYTVRF